MTNLVSLCLDFYITTNVLRHGKLLNVMICFDMMANFSDELFDVMTCLGRHDEHLDVMTCFLLMTNFF